MPNLRDADNVEPSLTTERNTLTFDQLRNAFFIFVEQHNVSSDTSRMCFQLGFGYKGKYRQDQIMTTLTISPSIWQHLAKIFTCTTKIEKTAAVPEHSSVYRRAEQDLINETIWSNPEMISSELGAHYILNGNYGRY